MRKGWRIHALDRLAAMSAARVAALAGVLLTAAGTLDWFSRAEIAASLGYLLPISVCAWGAGRIGAIAAGLSCAGAWLAIDLITHQEDLTPGLEVVNLVVLTVVFQLFGGMLATLREQLEQERTLARTDPLTALHNRRALWSAVAREVARARRHDVPFSLAYMDVDGFKGVNDTLGHHAGDALLRRIATTLQKDLRELDMVARPGGDEFVVLFPNTDDAAAGRAVARLRKRLARAPWRHAFGEIDFSIGVLTVLSAPESVEQVVARADALMYQVKRSGRGLVLYDVFGDRGDAPPMGPTAELPTPRRPAPHVAG